MYQLYQPFEFEFEFQLQHFSVSLFNLTHLAHHSICARPFVVPEFNIWIPILDQFFESFVFTSDCAIWPAAGAQRVLANIWYVLALD